jgi:serine/threonine-protein kinase
MKRMPNRELEEVFAAALQCPLEERNQFLDRACHGDKALRQEIVELLDLHHEATAFFDALSNDIVAAASLELESAVRPRVPIGPYRTLQVIGRGGMGVVYRAVRADGEFDQQVALKLIHLDMETPATRARFLAERQLLARLTHPNIARLQDGGVTEEGRPYFVMEYVEGVPITTYCLQNRLPIEGILRLFLVVIDAVSYLHRNLVVHRDLKPSNIIVGRDGQLKLVDFGIAKLLADQSEAGGQTRTGEQLLTPEYAAPEQLTNAPVTTATDVYALGVVLYELLTGHRPHDRARTHLDSIRHETPAPPSAVVRSDRDHGVPEGETVPSQSATPDLAWRRLAGDLDNICLMAIRPEPERRYASAEQLGQDIERHLLGVPVAASGSTLGYRLAKFAQRHRRGIVAAAGLLALVVVGFVRERSLRGAAEQARSEAQVEAARAVAVSDFLGELLSSVDPEKAQGREVTVAEVLDEAAERLEGGHSLQEQPSVEAAVRLTIGDTYRALGRFAEAQPHLERALELRGGAGEEDPDALKVVESLGLMYYAQMQPAEAEPLLKQVLEFRVQLLGKDHPDTLTAMHQLANVFWIQGRYDEVEPLDRETLEIRRRVLGDDHPDTLRSLNGLATTLYQRARFAEAAEMFGQALAVQQQQLGQNHPDTLTLRHNLASAYLELGRYPEAESLQRDVLQARLKVLGEEQEDTAMSMHNLAVTLTGQARYEEAEALLLRAISVRERQQGEKGRLHFSMSYLADVYREQKRYAESVALYLSTLERQRENVGPEDADTLRTQSGLAELRLRQGDVPASETLITRVLEAQSRVLGVEHRHVLVSTTILARIRNEQQRFADAAQLSEKVVDTSSRVLGDDHPLVLDAVHENVRALFGQEQLEVAEPLALNLYRTRARKLGVQHPDTVEALKLIVSVYEAMNNTREAARYRDLLGDARSQLQN